MELPRPGEAGPGRLILNPSDEEVKGFVLLPVIGKFDRMRGGLHDAVNGRLVNAASHEKACGALALDCGAPGISMSGSDLPARPLPDQTPATLVFYDRGGKALAAKTW